MLFELSQQKCQPQGKGALEKCKEIQEADNVY